MLHFLIVRADRNFKLNARLKLLCLFNFKDQFEGFSNPFGLTHLRCSINPFFYRQKAFLEKSVDGDDSKGMQDVASPSKDNDISWSTSQVNESSRGTVLEGTRSAESTGHESDQHQCAFCRSEVRFLQMRDTFP